MSRAYLIRYETLKSLNFTRTATVEVIIVVYTLKNNSHGNALFRLTLEGWRINCPATIPRSMMIEKVVYDPSWEVNYVMMEEIFIELSILDIYEGIEERSFVRIENGVTTILQESEVVFMNLDFKMFHDTDYMFYTSGE
ncbi:hypothetical protein RF11_08282 [Thelohanellus kitauei]|uniref:Uncharacterized protein n=1 Tax=Thelohanellus kitauei TaxID=669202 RepID=A0A0C2N215_THEKT|nr:hypothetical protein RF11_08282 [Thelohanellus kitauei]